MSDNTNTATGKPELSGQVLLYKNPEPLNLDAHKGLGLKQVERPFGFVDTTHVVPLTVQEFGIAAASLPIIFAPDRRTPLAVMAARSGENTMVDEAGQWEMDAYIPAFIRRYPFVFAADQGNDNLVVCIDTKAEMIGENPDLPLFDGDQPSEYTKNAMDFLQDFERQRRATEEFAKVLNDMDLLEEKSVTFTPNNPDGTAGETIKVADYIAVSEEKLNALPAAKFLELKQSGALAGIYAHLVSLLQWQKLVNRAIRNPLVAANS
jgi:hypothetical protein